MATAQLVGIVDDIARQRAIGGYTQGELAPVVCVYLSAFRRALVRQAGPERGAALFDLVEERVLVAMPAIVQVWEQRVGAAPYRRSSST